MIYVLGSANADLVFRSPNLPAPGETLMGSSFGISPGGKGANQAVAAARLGSMVEFVGALGSDANGDLLATVLAENGVRLSHLRRVSAPTGCAGILVDDAGRNSIVVVPGANAFASSDEIPVGSFVLAQLEVPLAEVARAAEKANTFILNPAPAAELPDVLVARCTFITPNESETFALTGIAPVDDATCRAAASNLLGRGAKNVIITLGAEGVFWMGADGEGRFPAPAVDVVDTTAAGDAFNGALAHFVCAGESIAEAIRRAVVVASRSTTKVGAIESMPFGSDVG